MANVERIFCAVLVVVVFKSLSCLIFETIAECVLSMDTNECILLFQQLLLATW